MRVYYEDAVAQYVLLPYKGMAGAIAAVGDQSMVIVAPGVQEGRRRRLGGEGGANGKSPQAQRASD